MPRVTVTPSERPLPAFPFHWDVETEILAGRHALDQAAAGFTGAWELESPSGAVIVLETVGGTLCGIEVVVWPDVERGTLVVPHDAPVARLAIAAPNGEQAGVIELEAPIAAAANAAETIVHLRVGGARARSVRIAENVVADLDADGRLAGFWLHDLPLFPQGG